MARKKKPVIKGSDPAYTTDFRAGFKAIPTNMPNLEQKQEAVKAPKEMPVIDNASKPKAPAKPVQKRRTTTPQAEQKKYVYLFATPQKAHMQDLDELSKKGIEAKDVARIAGRRANSIFAPSSRYAAPKDVKRLSSKYRYTTTKNVETAILNELHKSADPLNLKSDASMLQGQYEKIFWEKLEEVIQELKES